VINSATAMIARATVPAIHGSDEPTRRYGNWRAGEIAAALLLLAATVCGARSHATRSGEPCRSN
jgi:hypothetical protein